MSKVYSEVNEGKVTYFKENGAGVKEIEHEEYIKERINQAEAIYDKVVEQAKKNGCVWTTWIQQHFKTDWYGAYHIIEKMRKEGLCTENDHEFGASKMIAK